MSILSEGDVCNELFLIVDGEVASAAPVDRGNHRSSNLTLDHGPSLDPEFLSSQQDRVRAYEVDNVNNKVPSPVGV